MHQLLNNIFLIVPVTKWSAAPLQSGQQQLSSINPNHTETAFPIFVDESLISSKNKDTIAVQQQQQQQPKTGAVNNNSYFIYRI